MPKVRWLSVEYFHKGIVCMKWIVDIEVNHVDFGVPLTISAT